jgi:hypothetical protein
MRSSALLLILVAASARAQTIDAAVSTLVAGHADPRDGRVYTVVPIYESVSATVRDVRVRGFDDLRLVVAAWGELAFGSPREGTITGDIDIGYIEGKVLGRRLEVRLGRQLVFGGAARVLPLDGAQLTVRIFRGVGVTVYGGVPVTPRFSDSRGDAAAGARAFYRPRFDTELGISFVHVEDKGRAGRQDLSADARWQPVADLALSGYAVLSTVEKRLAEADLAATWQPRWVRHLDVRVDYRRTAPDLFLPRSSILSVFALETRDEAGGYVDWAPLPRLRLAADYHAIVDDAGVGHRGGGRATLRLGPALETAIGVEARALKLPEQGYVQARLFAIERFLPTVTLTLDLDVYKLDKPVNGRDLSLTGAATLGWAFKRGWSAVVAALADSTPLVERRVEVMAKLVWNQTFRVHEVLK